jgi:hypothetical protein
MAMAKAKRHYIPGQIWLLVVRDGRIITPHSFESGSQKVYEQ